MLSEYDRTWCTKLLADLTKWTISSPFRMPVDPIRDGAPNYPSIVKKPMDFHTMKKKLSGSEYNSVQEFVDDIQLICDNAKLFNGATSMYGLICDDIMAEVHRQYSEKPTSLDDEWYKAMLKAGQALEEHLRQAPPEITLAQVTAPAPNFEKIQLSAAQKETVSKIVGTTKMEKVAARWPLFNDATKNQIISVIGDAGRK
jgi:hypothetical protein